ncbi:MAG TPA: metallophosphoesterase [Tepidisphaeraceae bacterium]|nr:metallophosphoesterase [Tepidisphaeraceae bacterium]
MAFFKLLLILVTLAALDVGWWRAADRRLHRRGAPRWCRAFLAIFMCVLLVYLALSLAWPDVVRGSRGPAPMIVHAVAYLWHFMVLPVLIVGMIGGALLRAIGRIRHRARRAAASRISSPSRPSSSAVAGRAFSRRQLLASAAVAAAPLAAVAMGGGTLAQMQARRLRRFNLQIPDLPTALEGMTITHVSDTHIGKFLHASRLPEIADAVNALGADFIVFTGDLIDAALDDLPAGIDFLRRLKPRCGMAICEGNHDLFQNRGEFEWRIRDSGLPALIGEQRTLLYSPPYPRKGQTYPVQFLGLQWNPFDDWMNESFGYLHPLVRPDAFPILLAHHPHAFDPAARSGIPLTLSGHTHGGQIMLTPNFGAGSLRFRYISGLYQKPGSQLIVNNGIGNWFPLRINAPAELGHVTLRRGRPDAAHLPEV